MIIAITGYIGAGKTTTASFFHENGFRIIEVDELGHQLLDNEEVRDKLKAELGTKILDRDLKIDRDKLSKLVFNDEDKLKTLNTIVHPFLLSEIKDAVEVERGNTVIDVALYDELKIGQHVHCTIMVTADLPHVYERLAPQYSKSEILTVMNNQKPIKRPDYILENNSSIEDLKRRVHKLIDNLQHGSTLLGKG